MSGDLLAKTERLGKVIQKSNLATICFEDLIKTLSHSTNSNVYIIDHEGRVLEYWLIDMGHAQIQNEHTIIHQGFGNNYNNEIFQTRETSLNINIEKGNFFDDYNFKNNFSRFLSTTPIIFEGNYLGALIIEKLEEKCREEDLVLAKFVAIIIGMAIINSKTVKKEEKSREKAALQKAIRTLPYSELKALYHIISELNGTEGLLVASRVADRVGITRSVIANALKKLESAGIIESRSLGMKGTYIKIHNVDLLAELERNR